MATHLPITAFLLLDSIHSDLLLGFLEQLGLEDYAFRRSHKGLGAVVAVESGSADYLHFHWCPFSGTGLEVRVFTREKFFGGNVS